MNTPIILVPVEGERLKYALWKGIAVLDAAIRAQPVVKVLGRDVALTGDAERAEVAHLREAARVVPDSGVCYIDSRTAARLGLADQQQRGE